MAHHFSQPNLEIPFQSIRGVLDKYCLEQPDKIALYDLEKNRSISWRSLSENAELIAKYLVSIGIQKGDRIALLSDESLEKMIIWM